MKRDPTDWSAVWEQTLEILQTLEYKCGVYNLIVDGIPIWWFARSNFLDQMNVFLGQSTLAVESIKAQADRKGTLPYCRVLSKSGPVFAVRSVVGGLRFLAAKGQRRPVLLLSHPRDLRRGTDGNWTHTYYGHLLNRLEQNAVIVERIAFTEQSYYSLRHSKDTIFMDWAVAWAALKHMVRRASSREVIGWSDFASQCHSHQFSGISSERVVEFVRQSVSSHQRMAVVKVNAARLILKNLAPRVVLITHYDSDPKAFIFAAKEMRIPTIELQHGAIGYESGYTYFIPSSYRGPRVVPDHLFVFGKAFRDELLSERRGNGFGPEQISVTGLARLSAFVRESQGCEDAIRNKTRTKLGVADDAFLVTVTLSYLPSRDLFPFLEQCLEQVTEAVLCIKLHPLSGHADGVVPVNLAQHSRVRVISDKDVDLYELLLSSDLHATANSTVLLECLSLGVPNVVVKLAYYQPIFRLGGQVYEDTCAYAETPAELVSQIRRMCREPEYREQLIANGRQAAKDIFYMEEAPDELMAKKILEMINA